MGVPAVAPNLYVASYALGYKSALSGLVIVAAVIVVGAGISSPSEPSSVGLWFMVAATLFTLLTGRLLLTIWRSRVVFREDGMLICGPFTTSWRNYREVGKCDQTSDRLVIHFSDGSNTSINRHMGDLAKMSSVLKAKVSGR